MNALPPDELDALVEAVAAAGQIASGRSPAWVAAQSGPAGRRGTVVLAPLSRSAPRAAPWTTREDEFLRAHLGVLSEAEIAQSLGRTRMAVHLRWSRDLKLPAPSKNPVIVTGHRIAQMLGVDEHAVVKWIDRGILPGRRLPGERTIRVVDRRVLTQWVVNPAHWIYFDPRRVRDRRLRRLLALARKRWNDEWWTPGQAARYHGVDHRAVNQAIRDGRLPAVKWGNWHILRSDAVRARFRQKGDATQEWSEAGDAFLVLANAVGLPSGAIAAMMGWTDKRALYRLSILQRDRRVAGLIRKHRLQVRYISRTGELFADWKDYRDRFPRLAQAMEKLVTGRLDRVEMSLVRGVLVKWAVWSGRQDIACSLRGGHGISQARLRRAYHRLRAAGVDPLCQKPGRWLKRPYKLIAR